MTKDWFFFFFGKLTFFCGGFLCGFPLGVTIHHLLFPFLCEAATSPPWGIPCHWVSQCTSDLIVWGQDTPTGPSAAWVLTRHFLGQQGEKVRNHLSKPTVCRREDNCVTGVRVQVYWTSFIMILALSHELPLILEVVICIAPCEPETSLSCCSN